MGLRIKDSKKTSATSKVKSSRILEIREKILMQHGDHWRKNKTLSSLDDYFEIVQRATKASVGYSSAKDAAQAVEDIQEMLREMKISSTQTISRLNEKSALDLI